MFDPAVWQGIIIGAVGGAIAGLTVPLSRWLVSLCRDFVDKRSVYAWLEENTADKKGEQFRSTRAIASYNNLTPDRVRYVCSSHRNIFLSTGEKEDMWGIYAHNPSRKRKFET